MSYLRPWLGASGLLAGLATYWLFDGIEEWEAGPWVFALAMAAGWPIATALMSAPRGFIVAAFRALLLAIPAAGLLYWSTIEFGGHEPLAYFAYVILMALGIPLLAAERVPPRPGMLFEQAERIVIHGLAALLFLALFWLAYFLSDALLRLVDVDQLRELAKEEPFVFSVSGLVLGLGIAIASEQEALERAGAVLINILRLLVLPILCIVVIFLVGLFTQGIDEVFRSFSAAGTMLGMAAGATLLVISVVDGADEMASRNRWLVLSARVLSLFLPVLVGLSLYAIWLRVAQYGWSPERIGAAMICAGALVFTIAHALASLFGGTDWKKWHRSGTRLGWVTGMVLAAITLTPLADPYAISANSQLSRFLEGQTDVTDLDANSLLNDWGTAGKSAFDEIASQSGRDDQEKLDEVLELAREGLGQPGQADETVAVRNEVAELLKTVPIYPIGAAPIDVGKIKNVLEFRYLAGNGAATCSETPPKCAVLRADFDTSKPGDEAMFLYSNRNNEAGARLILEHDDGTYLTYTNTFGDPISWDALEPKLRSGQFEIMTPNVKILSVDGARFVPSSDVLRK